MYWIHKTYMTWQDRPSEEGLEKTVRWKDTTRMSTGNTRKSSELPARGFAQRQTLPWDKAARELESSDSGDGNWKLWAVCYRERRIHIKQDPGSLLQETRSRGMKMWPCEDTHVCIHSHMTGHGPKLETLEKPNNKQIVNQCGSSIQWSAHRTEKE